MSKLVARDPKTVKTRSLTALVYAKPGDGKTYGATGFECPLMIDIEGGCTQPEYLQRLSDNGGGYIGPEDGALNFSFVLSQIEALAKEEHAYRTLIIDSFSKLFHNEVAVEWDRMRSRGQNMASTYGAEKKPAINLTRQLIRRLDALDMITLIICHETTAWSNGQVNGTTADTWDKMFYELDLTLHLISNGSQRLARIEKSRLSGFVQGTAFPWCYPEFRKLLDASGASQEVSNEV